MSTTKDESGLVSDSFVPANNTTLYAVFVPGCLIWLHTQSGRFADGTANKDIIVRKDQAVGTIPAVVAPEGYHFVGWKAYEGTAIISSEELAQSKPTVNNGYTAVYEEGAAVADISTAEVTGITAKTYTGKAITQTPVVTVGGKTLEAGTDYDVTYSNNTNVGTATVTITGKGNYTGTKDVTFAITAKKITPKVTLSKTAFTYTGKVQRPIVTVYDGTTKLNAADYALKWSGAGINAGSYTATVTLKGNYSGTKQATYKINAKKITPKVLLSKIAFVYNGKVQKPKVIVKNGKATMPVSTYIVKFSGACKNVGLYKVTVTMKGNYAGTGKASFKINPKGTVLTKVTAGKKLFIAKWKNQAIQTTGYQLQYSLNNKFNSAGKTKTVTLKKDKVAYTQKKLLAKKKYFVRIRTYKQVGKVKYYSKWSTVRNATTK